ncbi:MAG: sulfite exporter TauE/SafE family protein [Anaerolineales bacterium]
MFLFLVILIGALALVFSMLGLGGALVYNPLMVWFGYDFKTVVIPTGLLLNMLTVASAAWVYYRRKMIDFAIGIPLMLTSALGSFLGAYLTETIPTTALLWALALFILFAAVQMLSQSNTAEPDQTRGAVRQRVVWGSLVGLGVGLLSGMLGVGGGALIVPLLIWMGYPTKIAAATTAFTVVFSSMMGVFGHLTVGHFDWTLMLTTGMAVIIGSQIGARLMYSKASPALIKRLFGLVLIFIAAKMIFDLI